MGSKINVVKRSSCRLQGLLVPSLPDDRLTSMPGFLLAINFANSSVGRLTTARYQTYTPFAMALDHCQHFYIPAAKGKAGTEWKQREQLDQTVSGSGHANGPHLRILLCVFMLSFVYSN